ncbi:MAG: SpoIIE family protein phosphatase [Spirochaetales bacterium]|nr:SpoIIE family protein phosphatase [Spirochaetales bacterium]MCP5485766.1 SpoIIE family protein phosphatase [Spirochaetales bacterium]
MKPPKVFRLVLPSALCLLFGAGPVFAAPPVILSSGVGSYALGTHLDYLEDPDGNLSIEDVSSARFQDDWVAGEKPTLSFGYTASAYWLRFEARSPSPPEGQWLVTLTYDILDRIDFYAPLPDGNWKHVETGDTYPFAHREVPSTDFQFRMPRPFPLGQMVYIRIKTQSSMVLPLTLWQESALALQSEDTRLLLGIFYGIVLVMALYNLFLFTTIREVVYLYYVLYLTSFACFQLGTHGISFKYLWPEYPWWNDRSSVFFVVTTAFFLLLFSRSFLDTRHFTPRLDWALRILTAACLIPMGLSLFVGHKEAAQIIVPMLALVLPLLLTVAVLSYRRGNASARYYLASCSLFLLGSLLFVWRSLGILPSNFWTEHGLQIGSTLEVVLLSLGLADRYTQEKKARLLAQQEAIENLHKADQLKDDFLSNTSHELRTPLHGIIGITESILQGATGGVNEPTYKNLELVATTGRRLSNLVNDILDFSELQHDDLRLKRRAFDISPVIGNVLALSRPLIGNRPVELIQETDNLPLVFGDEERVEQILHNLIGNAIKFTKSGQVTVRGRVTQDDRLELIVSDTGIGIPEDKRAMIFEPFTQVDASISREYGGTGIGLSVTKKLVELHGGAIRVEGAPGRGSQFVFDLPMAAPDISPTEGSHTVGQPEQVAAAPNADQPAPEPRMDLPPHTPGGPAPIQILIVDDDPVNLQVLRNQLGLRNHSIAAALNGREALQYFDQGQTFDLVLLDVMMPGLSGYEVCRILRESYSPSELPIIMLTAKNRVPDIIAGLESGANDYLTKPFDARELLARVGTMVKLKQAAQSQSTLATLKNEMQMAREMQRSLLPSSVPEVAGLKVVARYRSMTSVGGDFYYFGVQNGGLGAILADVSGHGVPAALIVSIVKMAFWFQKEQLQAPDLLLGSMNQILLGNIGDEFVTGAYAFVDTAKKRLLVGNAGHPPVLIWKKERNELLHSRPFGRLLGLLPDAKFKSEEVSLDAGDKIIMYTDGIYEAINENEEQFGRDRLYRFAANEAHRSGSDFADELIAQVIDWSGGEEKISDDIALIVIDVE